MKPFLAFLLLLPLHAAAELNGLSPQRRTALEALMADPHTLRGEALATSQAIERWDAYEPTVLALRKAWSQVEEIDARTHMLGEHLSVQIESKLGEGKITAATASEHRRCVEDSVNGRRVLVFGYLWPRTVSEGFKEAGMTFPADIRRRLELKAYESEVRALGFEECGARMRADGIMPLNP